MFYIYVVNDSNNILTHVKNGRLEKWFFPDLP